MCYLQEGCLNSGGLRVKLSCMDSSLGGNDDEDFARYPPKTVTQYKVKVMESS